MKQHRAALDAKLAEVNRKPRDVGILWSVRVLVAAGTPKDIVDKLEALHYESGANGGFILAIIEKLCQYCDGAGARGRTLTLKVKYADFQQITRSRTLKTTINTQAELEQISRSLLQPVFPTSRGIRLLGLSLSSLGQDLSEPVYQLRLGL